MPATHTPHGVIRRSAAASAMALAAAVVGLLPAAAARAQTLPSFVYNVGGDPYCAGTTADHFSCSFSGPSAQYHYDGTASVLPMPNVVSNTVVDSLPAAAGIGGHADVRYSFSVTGPSGLVPILVTASATTAASGDAGATAAWIFDQVTVETACSTSGVVSFCSGMPPASFAGTTPLSVYAGVANTIEIIAATAASGPAGSATARLDPSIQIDPSFPDASQYQLALSDGVGNAPEPSAVELGACTLLALAVRRGRCVSGAAAA